MDATWLRCMVGFALFCIGGVLRMYIVVRTVGFEGWFANQSQAIEAYKKQIDQKQVPMWPLPASYLCIGCGIATVFGSILFSNN